MTRVTIDGTGVLRIGGRKVFPICLSNPPPPGRKAPSGENGWQELANAGATLIRTGLESWSPSALQAQIAGQRKLLDGAAAHGLLCWLWLGNAGQVPGPESVNARLLNGIVNAFKGHPGLGVWKGADEPANPLRGEFKIPAADCIRAYQRLRRLDTGHPLVIIQAPRNTVAQLRPYRPAFDLTGADIYPVSYPPGLHAGGPNHDISVVGDITRKLRSAAGPKPVWTTLQIAFSGTAPTREHPNTVPRFPTKLQERFMAYQAIVAGARGLVFFGGHLTEVCTPDDARLGWNWTFWRETLRPVIHELTSSLLRPALVAPSQTTTIKPKPPAGDVQLIARRGAGYLYVIAVRRGGDTTQVTFTGLPRRRADGTALTRGEVLFEHTQQPPPPPRLPSKQLRRVVHLQNGSFHDWFGPHDVHVYRFDLGAT
jgi:hypothetical protein